MTPDTIRLLKLGCIVLVLAIGLGWQPRRWACTGESPRPQAFLKNGATWSDGPEEACRGCDGVAAAFAAVGGIRAVEWGKPSNPDSVERYLEDKFGEDLKAVRSAMEKLAKAYPPMELAVIGFSLYGRFRPKIPAGVKEWGAAGNLDLGVIQRLAKEGP